MRLSLHKSFAELAPLRAAWDALLARSAADTMFLTWTWCESWWRAYGRGRPLYVVAAWDADELVGLAPLYLDRERRAGLSWNVLRIIGDGSQDSDYLDLIAASGREPEVMAAFVNHLEQARGTWDCLEVHGAPAASPGLKAILELAGQRGRWRHKVEEIPCSTLVLPATWDELMQRLKPRTRTKVRSALAFAENRLGLRPRQCARVEELREWLPLFMDMHGRRWNSKGQSGVFTRPDKQEFYEALSRHALAAGYLAFHRLDWGERAIAFQYGFWYRDKYLLLQEAYDPDFEELRAGIVLRAMVMREAIAQGWREYDFLAGVAKHKLDWSAEERPALKVTLASSRASAAALLQLPEARQHTKDAIRKIIPEAVLRARKRLLAARSLPRSTGSTPAEPQPSLARTLIARGYSASPLSRFGRWAADRYALRAPGILHRRSEPVCQILIFHHVGENNDPFLASTPVDRFRLQMEYLVRRFDFVTLDDLACGKVAPEGKRFSLALTFDDGYRDNFTHAFPILKELGIPATIFLATGCVDTGELPWYDQVRLAFKLTTAAGVDMRHLGGPAGSLTPRSTCLNVLERILPWLQSIPEENRRGYTEELLRALRVPSPLVLPNFMLTWEDVREMSKHNISFGAHTVTHPVLSRVTGEQLASEIRTSKAVIERKLRLPVRHFAYPFGGAGQVNEEVVQAVREAGFQTAVTTMAGFNTAADDLLRLKRLTPWSPDVAMFGAQMDWYRLAGFESPGPSQVSHRTASLHSAARVQKAAAGE